MTNYYLDDKILSEFKYTTINNPFYEVSRSYLLNIPVYPYENEKEFITSKKMLSNAIHYNIDGEIEEEIIYNFDIGDNGFPISGEIITNGNLAFVTFEYE